MNLLIWVAAAMGGRAAVSVRHPVLVASNGGPLYTVVASGAAKYQVTSTGAPKYAVTSQEQ